MPGPRSDSERALRRAGASLRGSACALILFAALAARAGAQAAVGNPTEHEVKAAFLYHFAQLVTWPATEGESRKPIVIAIVGRDPFGGVIDATVGGQSVRGRPFRVVRARSVGELAERPEILFLGTASLSDAEGMLAALADAPVLTVGELAGLAARGCMIEFRITNDGRVSFDVNLKRAERAGLRLSSQLLKVARVVEGRP